jgi:hypothetical protein
MDLLERIQNANKRSELNNRKSAEAQAQLKLLTKQISELVADYEQKFGISFPNIEDEAKFTKFVNDLLATTEADLEKQVTVAEKVNQLILEGDIIGAQELLGYEPAEEVVKETDDVEVTKDAERVTEEPLEVELEDVAPKRVISEEPVVKPIAPVRKVVEDLEEEEFVAPVKQRTVVGNAENPLVKSLQPVKQRVLEEDEDEDLAPFGTPNRRVINDDELEDLDDTPIVRPASKRPIVTSNFDMGEEEKVGVSLSELNAVAGVAPKGVSPKPKSPIVTDDLEEEEIVGSPRRRPIIVNEDDSDDVAPARPVRSGGSFKFD